jgi:hypothetical protein
MAAGLRSVAAVVGRHRRLLASVCAGGAVVVAVSAVTPPPAGSSTSDDAGGARPALLPAGAGDGPAGDADRVALAVRLADPAGLLLVRAGSHAEVLAGPAADVGMPPAPGTASGNTAGEVLAADAVVVAVPQPSGPGPATGSGAGVSGLLGSSGGGGGRTGLDGVVVLAVPPSDARRIAAAAGTRPLSVAVALSPRS